MDLGDRPAVDLAFRGGDQFINGQDVFLHGFGNGKPSDDGFDVREAPVYVMRMPVIMVFMMFMSVIMGVFFMMLMGMLFVMPVFVRAFLFAVYEYMHLRSRNAAFADGFLLKTDAGQPQHIQTSDKRVGIGQQFEQGSREHVAGGTHAAVQI